MAKQAQNYKHSELISQGWERRFSAEGYRFTEMNEYYQSLGFETLVVDGVIGNEAECRRCFDVAGFQGRYKTLYTRGQASTESSGDDDLFGA